MPKNDLPTPVTSVEKFAAKAAGMEIETPTPVTNMEKYLDAIAKGGGVSPDDAYTKEQTDALLDEKVDKVSGKGLSTNDFTAAEKSKLAGIAAGAEVNVQANWTQTSSSADDFIKNKPALGAAASKGVDSAPTASSTNLVTSGGVATALAAKLNTADVDDALSSTSANPVQNKAVQAPVARLVNAGAKNVLNLNTTFTTITHRGITYTNNNDGTILVNGTSNASDSYANLCDIDVNNLFGFNIGETVVIASTSDNVSISLVPKKAGGGYGVTVSGYKSSPAVYTIPSDFSGFILRISVPKNGTSVNNESVNGMICSIEDYSISPEFVPYAPSNRELYEMILALQNAQNGG